MLIKADIDRLDLTENIVAVSERWLKLDVTPPEIIRLVENEITNLDRYRADDPDRVDDLTNQLKAIAERLRRQIS